MLNYNFEKLITNESQLRVWYTKGFIKEICISEIHMKNNRISPKNYDIAFINNSFTVKSKTLHIMASEYSLSILQWRVPLKEKSSDKVT